MTAKSAKSFPKFIILWLGDFISAIGSGLTAFGLSVYVFQQTGLASAMALVTLLAFMPSLLLSAAAGVLADRYDRRLLMVIGDGLSAAGLIYILICMTNKDAALWQICVGVTISSIFSSLTPPAYKATVTDLLTQEQYTKASGLMGISGSAKYLISPVLAGFLLAASGIRLLLLIDICTFFLTVMATLTVRRGLAVRKTKQSTSFVKEFSEGWNAISKNRGVLVLVMMASVITFFIGFIQTLFAPVFLSFTTSTALGFAETVSACGMLVSSIVIGSISIKKGYVKMLSLSLFFAGIFMALFGIWENMVLLCCFGFLFFSMLPFANTSLDYLTRTNIDNELQGRAWGLIGVLSQLGYVFAYAFSGVLADSAGKLLGTDTGRGAGLLIIIAGTFLSVTAVILYHIKSVENLEPGGGLCISE